MTATTFVHSITNALNRWGKLSYKPNNYITHLLFTTHTKIPVDVDEITTKFGIVCVEVCSDMSVVDKPSYVEDELVNTIQCIQNE